MPLSADEICWPTQPYDLWFRFPFDEQQCHLKVRWRRCLPLEVSLSIVFCFQFGSWTYSENLLNLELLENNVRYEEEINESGIADNITICDDGIGWFLVFSGITVNVRFLLFDLRIFGFGFRKVLVNFVVRNSCSGARFINSIPAGNGEKCRQNWYWWLACQGVWRNFSSLSASKRLVNLAPGSTPLRTELQYARVARSTSECVRAGISR